MDRDIVGQMIATGASHREISERFDVPRQKVAEFCSLHQILKRPVWTSKRPTYVDDIKRLTEEEGLQQWKVAEMLQLDRSTVERWCRRMKIKTQRVGPRDGDKHPNWKGGVRILGGYRYLYMPDHPHATKQGAVAEHRLVVESVIGRFLGPKEVVHHKNGDKLDNRPENLVLYESNGAHLNEDLKGRVPAWSEDGKRRIKEAIQRIDHSYMVHTRIPVDNEKLFRLIAEDKLIMHEIAAELGISRDTLRNHCKRIGLQINWKSRRSRLRNANRKK